MNLLLRLILGLSLPGIAYATPVTPQKPAPSAATSTASPSPTPGPGRGVAVGLSTNGLLLKTDVAALTALFSKDEKTEFQAALAIPQTDPFLYSLGATLYFNVHGTPDLGFHTGGGLGLGSHAKDLMFFRLAAQAGFHWTMLERLVFRVDAGLALSNEEKPSGSDGENQLILSGNSSLVGLSILYRFE